MWQTYIGQSLVWIVCQMLDVSFMDTDKIVYCSQLTADHIRQVVDLVTSNTIDISRARQV